MANLNDALSILCEACGSKCDEDTMDDIVLDDMEDEIEDEYDDVDEYEDDIFYSEEMVPVIGVKGGTYLIEADMLGKYMISNEITEADEAINKIAEHNAIDATATGVLIESSDYFKQMINEAKSCKGSSACNKKKAQVKSGIDLLKNLKNKGIKIIKKKAKVSKKKKN